MKFIRRVNLSDYTKTETVSIGSGGGFYDIDDLPEVFDEGIEVQLDDGTTYVLLAYKRK